MINGERVVKDKLDNEKTIQAIEILNGTQALEFRRPLKSSKRVEEIVAKYRAIVPFVEKDKYLQPEIAKSRDFVVAGF